METRVRKEWKSNLESKYMRGLQGGVDNFYMRHREWRHFRQKKELSNRGLMCLCKEGEHENGTLFPRIESF